MQKLMFPDFILARYTRLLFALVLLFAAPSAHAKCLRLGLTAHGGISADTSEILNSCEVRVGYAYCVLNATAGSPFSCADQKFGAGFVVARGKDVISIYGATGPLRVLWAECEAQGPDDYPIPNNPQFNTIAIDASCPMKKDKPPTPGENSASTANPFTVPQPSANGSNNPFIAGNQDTNRNNPFTNNGNSSRSSQDGPNSNGTGNLKRGSGGNQTVSSGGPSNCPGIAVPLIIRFTLADQNNAQALGTGSLTIVSCDRGSTPDGYGRYTVHMATEGTATISGDTYKFDNPQSVSYDSGYTIQNSAGGPCYYADIGPAGADLGRGPGVVVSFIYPRTCIRQNVYISGLDEWQRWQLYAQDGPAAEGYLRIE